MRSFSETASILSVPSNVWTLQILFWKEEVDIRINLMFMPPKLCSYRKNPDR